MAGIPNDVAAPGFVTLEAFTAMADLNKELALELDAAEAKIRELSRLLIEERARVTQLTLQAADLQDRLGDILRIWDGALTRRRA